VSKKRYAAEHIVNGARGRSAAGKASLTQNFRMDEHLSPGHSRLASVICVGTVPSDSRFLQ
jgi:hypothetical protein